MGVDVKVTVIIPSYNMGEYIGSAISTVLNGSFSEVEVLVVDDGSTDHTENVVSRFVDSTSPTYDSRVRYIRQKNQGKPAAVNRGFRLAQGEYVTILDADDELPPGGIKDRYDVATATSPPADCVVGPFVIINDQGERVGHRSVPGAQTPEHLLRKYFLSYLTPFHLNACLIHRRLVKRVGKIDTELNRCEDIDYAIRLLKSVRNLRVLEVPVYRYRKYRDSMKERIRMRWVTLKKRQVVLARHAPFLLKPAAITIGIAVDTLKLLYEVIVGNYHS